MTIKLSTLLAKGLVVFVFLLSSSGALVPLLRQQSGSTLDVSQSDPVTQSMWIGIYIIASLLLLMRWQLSTRVVMRDKILLLLVGFALFSVFWSAAPEITFRRGVALVGTTLFGVYLAAHYSLRDQLKLLAWALGTTALLSLLFALALPSYGISSDPTTSGDWRGIFPHKNALGRSMTLSAVVFGLLAASVRKYRWISVLGVALSCGLLLLSNSVTGLLITLILLALWPLYRALRWRHTAAVPFLIIAVLVGGGAAMLVLSNSEAVLDTLGRDATLTGRTEVWAAALDMIRERPWLGYGYSAFWLGWEGYSSQLWLATGKQFVHSQNGFLDLWLELGLLGVTLFTLGLVLAFLRAASRVRFSVTIEEFWPLVFLTFFLLYNLTEVIVLQQNNIYWILYVSAVLSPFSRHAEVPRHKHLITPRRGHQAITRQT